MRFWPSSWLGSRPRAAVAGCREAMRELQTYLDGGLDEQAAPRIARHLADCRRCGLEARIYTEIKTSLARRDREAPDDAVARLREFAAHLPDQDTQD